MKDFAERADVRNLGVLVATLTDGFILAEYELTIK